jgi:hypothetical protein
MLKTSRHIRTLLFGAVIALMVGLLGPVSPATAAPAPVSLTASITGTPIVGQTLTAVASNVSPSNNVTFSYKWETTDSAATLGTASTFVLTSAQIGKQIKVTITGTASNRDPGSSTSAPTAVVQGLFTAAPVVTIDDTNPVVDDEITATVTTPSTPEADSYTFEWFADGSSVGTGANYTPTPSDVGKTLVAKATPVKTNYVSSSGIGSSTATDAVAKADFNPGPTASITGTAKVGEELTAGAAGETPAGDGYTYQWSADSVDITGATNDKYTLTGAEAGKAITVTITTTRAGYNDSSDTSDATALVAKGDFTTAPTVTITGTAKAGEVLTANPTGEAPTADGYTYQWKADGTNVAGATSSTFTPSGPQIGKAITVTVTATKVGYNPSNPATSDPTAPVAMADFTSGPVAGAITGNATVGSTLTAHVQTPEVPAGDSYAYEWLSGGVVVAGETSSTYVVRTADIGKTITVKITAIKSGYNPSAKSESPETALVESGVFSTPPTVTLSTTTPKVGDVVTANATGGTPTPTSYDYDWYRIDTLGVRRVIPGAIGQSYTVPYADLTKKLQVEVTAVRAGYERVSTFSAQTARINYIALSKTSVTRGQTIGVNAKRLRAGQAYKIFVEGKSVYSGTATSDGSAIRTVTVPTSTPVGTGKRIWVSGYNKSGVRDFQVIGTVTVN